MATIQITDKFGLNVDVQSGILSSLEKYAANLSKISLTNLNLQSLADLTLANPSITSLHAGLTFDEPVNIGLSDVTLTLDSALDSSLDIYVPPTGGGNLFDDDEYGEKIPVAADERYVSIALKATAGPAIANTAGTLGFQPSAKVSLTNYRKFVTQPAAPTILEAVKTTVADLCIPADAEGLAALPTDAIVTLEGIGSISFSATANLLAATNPLATLSTLPSPLPVLEISEGGAVTVAASCTVTWEYQLRIRKLDSTHVSLGFYRKHGTDTSVSVKASAGISAGTSSTDLFSKVIAVVSKSAAADGKTMASLGMSDDQAGAISSAVKNAAQRKLEVSLLGALTAGDSQSAAFLYQFDLTAWDDTGKRALANALRGDLNGLTGDTLPAGVQMTRSIATDLRERGGAWKINLLGIYNYASTTDLVRQGTVTFEPVTGDLVIADKASAQRIDVSTVNFGADSDKLRHLLAESFLITAVYRGSQALVTAPEISCSHSYFEMQSSPGADKMRTNLTAATALGLLDDSATGPLIAGIQNFGRTSVYAETTYSKEIAPRLFLNGGEPKQIQEFETAGRQAMLLLVRDDASDAFRLRGVSNDQLWAAMCDKGQPGFPSLFPGLPKEQVDVIASDYTAIVWWADAMSQCAVHVAAMNRLVASGADPHSPQFVAERAKLAQKLGDVSAHTKNEFGQPWGLVAMDRVSGNRADARVQIAGTRFALARNRKDVEAGTAATSS